ncbi:MAG: ATP-dependent DNA helicase RecQ [Planctomycetes bacterium]|nr:ATP-dependent DNA helicase RecQ [Planctomycetota bacterium]
MPGPDPDLDAALRRLYGFSAFRGPQREICSHFLRGGSALVLMATGDGKSLCYQLPSFVGEGLTVVVSPLIALMDDQVAALRHRELPATCVHSMLERSERDARLAAVERGDVKLLFCTPERFRVTGFLDRIRARGVARLAIDEAHCLSQWGHDFRPDYLRLGEVRRALGDPPCLALTATATPQVQRDIRATLGLDDAPLFHTGVDRDNLFLSVHEAPDDQDKLERLSAVLERTGGPAIVYCALIKDLRWLEGELQRRGLQPMVYHGDLSAHERRTQQARFQASRDALMLATNAFGMGVDKADIRAIVHWQLPRTLEAYYQEVGRAGRDGDGAFCELLYREEDLVIQRNFAEWANPTAAFARELIDHMEQLGDRLHAADVDTLRDALLHKNRHDGRVDTVLRLLRSAGCTTGEPGHDLALARVPDDDELADWLPDDKRQNDLMGLLRMVRYATEMHCRKATIHSHFGFDDDFVDDDGDEVGCGACDVCTDAAKWQDAHLPQTVPVPRVDRRAAVGAAPEGDDPADATATVERGDWLDVQGLGLCHVVRVHRRGRTVKADVERLSDLQQRTVDLRRRKWQKVRE